MNEQNNTIQHPLSDASNALLQQIIGNSEYSICSLDTNYRYTFYNQKHFDAMKSLYGVEIKLGMIIFDYQTIEADRLRVKINIDRALKGEIVFDEWKQGDEARGGLYFSTQIKPLKDSLGSIIGAVSYSREITGLKMVVAELEENKDKFQHVFEFSPIGISLTRVDGTMELNNAFCDILGYSQDELKTKKMQEVTHPDDVQKSLDIIQSLINGEITKARFEKRYIHRNGSVVWADLSTTLQIDKEGKPQFFITSINNITEYKRIQNALEKSEASFRNTLDSMLEGCMVIGFDWTYRYVNEGAARHGRKKRDEILGQSILELYPGVEQTEIFARYNECMTKRTSQQFESSFTFNDGTLCWYEFRVLPIPEGIFVFSIDITERKRTESEREQFFKFFNLSSDIMVIADPNGAFKQINPTTLKLLGYSETELISKPFIDFVHQDDKQSTLDEMAKQIQIGSSFDFENRYVCKDGTFRWLSWRAYYNKNEGITYATARDITERKVADEALRTASSYNRRLIEASIDPLVTIGADGKITDVNEATETVTGVSRGKLIGDNFSEYFTEPERANEGYLQVLKKGAVRDYPLTIRHASGKTTDVLYNATVYKNEKDDIQGVFAAARDITERKVAEEALRTASSYNRRLIEASIDPFVTIGADGKITDVNEATEIVTGVSRGKLIGDNFSKYFTEPERANEGYLQVLKKGVVRDYPLTIRHVSGNTTDVLYNATVYKNEKGEIQGVFAAARDITDIKQAEAEIRKINRIYAVISQINQMIIRANDQNELFEEACRIAIQYGNFRLAWVGLINESDQTVRPTTWYGEEQGYLTSIKNISLSNTPLGHGPTGIAIREGKYSVCNDIANELRMAPWCAEALKRGYCSSIALPIITNGKTIGAFTIYTGEPFFFNDQEIRLLEEITDDIRYALEKFYVDTQRKKAEQALIESENRFRCLSESSLAGIYIVKEGRLTYANPALAKIFGYTIDELIEADPLIIIHPDDRALVTENLRRRFSGEIEALHYEFRGLCKNGKTIFIEVLGTRVTLNGSIAIIGNLIDITERKRIEKEYKELEQTLIQSQKLESIGTLAGGIAHDFNNILSIILGHSSLIKIVKRSPEALQESLDVIDNAVKRGSDLVKQILTFARKSETVLGPLSINTMVKEHVKMLSETFPKIIIISLNLDKSSPSIIADPTQIYQVLMNLCVNARDAMPNGGTLTIRTELYSKNIVSKQFSEVSAEHYLCLSISDTGIGMDEATRKRIFDPFFTTKEKGKGTGLGLAVVYGIIKSHEGHIDVISQPGKGTTFNMYFPIPKNTENNDLVHHHNEENIPGGTETILLIEDETGLREMIKVFLEMNGYKVITAIDGEEALLKFSQHKDSIDIIFSDMGLPKITGEQMYFTIKRLYKNTKCIFASGFIEPNVRTELLKAGVKDILLKPYKPTDVLKALRKALDNLNE